MSKELLALLEGLFLGLLTVGLGGILIGTTAEPGLAITGLAVLGYAVLHYVRGNEHE